MNEPFCQKRLKQLCHDTTVPDCRVVREKRSLPVDQEVCNPVARREVFEWTRTVCDTRQMKTKYKVVRWENQSLKEANSTVKTELKNITRCNFTFVNETKHELVPQRNRTDEVVSREVCQRVPKTTFRVVEQMQMVLSYVPECQMVNQQVCSQSPCQINGCTDGGSVCSSTESRSQTVCAQAQQTGEHSACQNVQTPMCYGQAQQCYPGQQCCSQAPRQVCRQIPRRVPVRRNVTIPQVTYETECRTVNQTVPKYETTYVNKTITKQRKICNKVTTEMAYNYTLPSYEVVVTNKSEKVPFVMNECTMRNVTERYYHTFPNADFKCTTKTVIRQYLLNKVVCDRKRPVKFCSDIPESDCRSASNQQCKMVPRQVCQPGCASSQTCNQCDSMIKQGGFSSCSTSRCPNFYSNTYIGGQGGQRYSPGSEGGYTGAQPSAGEGFSVSQVAEEVEVEPELDL